MIPEDQFKRPHESSSRITSETPWTWVDDWILFCFSNLFVIKQFWKIFFWLTKELKTFCIQRFSDSSLTFKPVGLKLNKRLCHQTSCTFAVCSSGRACNIWIFINSCGSSPRWKDNIWSVILHLLIECLKWDLWLDQRRLIADFAGLLNVALPM